MFSVSIVFNKLVERGRIIGRQREPEARAYNLAALAYAVLGADLSAVCANNSPANRKTQSNARLSRFFLSAREFIEEACLCPGRQTRTIVVDANPHVPVVAIVFQHGIDR
jgi:hypothetical protein